MGLVLMSADVGRRFSELQFPIRRSLSLPAALCKEYNMGDEEGVSVMYFFKRNSETFLCG